jgi:hypothetical protein
MRPVALEPRSLFLAVLLAGALPSSAWAGRPLDTDDASTADVGTCQAEGWVDRDRDTRAWVLSPACGVAEGVELGAEFVRFSPRDPVRAEGGLALKVALPAWGLEGGGAKLRFGFKAALGHQQPADAGWQHSEASLLALASAEWDETWAVHANLGLVRDRQARETATVLSAAIVWNAFEQLTVFAETSHNNKRETLGGAAYRAGLRGWLVPERFGVDFTAGRVRGSTSGTTWGMGLGWYGIRLF